MPLVSHGIIVMSSWPETTRGLFDSMPYTPTWKRQPQALFWVDFAKRRSGGKQKAIQAEGCPEVGEGNG